MLVGSRDEGWQVMPNAKTVIPLSMINCVIRVGAFCRYMNQTTFVLVDYPFPIHHYSSSPTHGDII
jgi:hypothetical protein